MMFVFEGNGIRPSHLGIGWKESEIMYTLNATEVHAVAYGLEPGAAQRLEPDKRIWKEKSPTLRDNAGDNQASVVLVREREYETNKRKVGALCATDHKWVQTQQIIQGKLIMHRVTR